MTTTKLSILISGPYSVENSGNKAIGIDDIECADGMELEALEDDHTSASQQFYIGNNGAIHSSKCRGLVISAPSDCSGGRVSHSSDCHRR